MIIVQIPKDIKKIEKKVIFGLTIRQFVCYAIGGLLGVLLYFITKALFHNNMVSIYSLLLGAFPGFMVSMYERDGFRAEQIFKFFIQKKIRNNKRTYQAEYVKELREGEAYE